MLKPASVTNPRLKFPQRTIQDSIVKPVAIFRHDLTEDPGYFATYLERHHIAWKRAPRASRPVEHVIARPKNWSVDKIR
jgi:hypothetical protein